MSDRVEARARARVARRWLACGWIGALALGLSVGAGACGGGSTATPATDAGVQRDGGTGDGSPAPQDGAVPQDGAAPQDGAVQQDGGTGGSPHAGYGLVSGGVSATSANYKFIGGMTSGKTASSSTNYQQRGGVVGATQKP